MLWSLSSYFLLDATDGIQSCVLKVGLRSLLLELDAVVVVFCGITVEKSAGPVEVVSLSVCKEALANTVSAGLHCGVTDMLAKLDRL